MAKESKFGTFGGVFTPSVLTILGVIMYLRLPWVTGHAGLAQTLGIVLVAHVVSFATGLSISSVATDKNVGAGGPYYIVSRSLGLPIGGALGLALFVGLSLSISLYIIGFSESFLGILGIEPTATNIRINGTIWLIVLTTLAVASTALAIKAQYFILGLIALSLLAIVFGDASAAQVPPETTREAPQSLATLFAIFFPAVTGFTAGVNMSGDLKDPKRAIPVGTIAAIVTGMVVYLGLVWFLTAKVPAEVLIADKDVLAHISWNPSWNPFGEFGLVALGIWGATLSSALGSILGAPRILQALSADGITPRFFAKGTGPTKEPRNALIVAFLIAEAGILRAELDAIAGIVSMVFLTMYGFLNLSCAIEAAVSPDFRPTFRIPKLVSVIGALTCVFLMIQLDPGSMIGATAVMLALFLWLQRRQLELESGDAWAGVWSSLVRSSLHRLTGAANLEHRNWRPNILAFHQKHDDPSARFSQALVTGSGLLTLFQLEASRSASLLPHVSPTGESGSERPLPDERGTGNKRKRTRKAARLKKAEGAAQGDTAAAAEDRNVGVFHRVLQTGPEPFETISNLIGHFGFTGLEPNTLLLDYGLRAENPEGFTRAVARGADLDFNVISHATGTGTGSTEGSRRIDIWWQADAGNVGFSLALLGFITRSAEWERSDLRFLLFSPDSANNDNLRTALRRVLREARIEAQIRIVNDSFGDRSLSDRVISESEDSALAIVGLPLDSAEFDAELGAEYDALSARLNQTLLVRGGKMFPELLPTGRSAAVSELPPLPEDGSAAELPELKLPESTELAQATTEMAEAHQRLVARLSEQSLQKVYGRHVELLRSLRKAVERHLVDDKVFSSGNPKKQKNTFNRQQSSLVLELKERFSDFATRDVDDLHSVLEAGIDAFEHDDRATVAADKVLLVERRREDFAPDKADKAAVRRFKFRKRTASAVMRRPPRYRLPVAGLRAFYFRRAKKELLAPSISAFVTESHQMLIQFGRLYNSTRAQLLSAAEDTSPGELVETQRRQLLEHLDELDRHGKELIARRRWALIVGATELAQDYASDISRLDFATFFRTERLIDDSDPLEDVRHLPALWSDGQKKLLERGRLALSLSSVQHRLSTIVSREADALELGMRTGALRQCKALLDKLRELRTRLSDGPTAIREVDLALDLKSQFDPTPHLHSLTRDCTAVVADLPSSLLTLTDDAIQVLEEGRLEEPETAELPVRRLVQFLLESELLASLESSLQPFPRLEQHALDVARDAVRLVAFQLTEYESSEGAETSSDAPEFESQLRPIVESGIERLESEVQKLSAEPEKLRTLVQERFHRVIDGSHPFELSRETERLEQHIRVEQGKRAVSGARGAFQRGVSRVRSSLVQLVYQKSHGVLLAHRRRQQYGGESQAVDRIRSLVTSELPRPEVIDALPFFYRQLYLGQSGINDSFWVGRDEQLRRARRAVKAHAAGQSGAVIVTGERLSGKTALIQRITSELPDRSKLLRIHPPAGGTTDPTAFDRALRKALDPNRELADGPAQIPAGAVVVLDDLELWWQRSDSGARILEHLLAQVDAAEEAPLLIVGMNRQAYRFVSRLTSLSERALAVLDCEPLSAADLQKTLSLRHKSSGMHFRLGTTPQDELGEIRLARHFAALFDHTGGSVGSALHGWVAGIEKVKGDELRVLAPIRKDREALDHLRPDWVALLLELFLHKQLTFARLETVSGLSRGDVRSQLDALLRMGLVSESSRRVYELEPGVVHLLLDRFGRKGILA